MKRRHAAAQRVWEAGNNVVPRTDFFGTKRPYHRDADGLYSPPPYLYDEMDANYLNQLANGPTNEIDIDKGMDGTVKHFTNSPNGLPITDGSRVCDYIQDRYGNQTNLTYGYANPGDTTSPVVLQKVTDPSSRSLTFLWTNLTGNPAQPGKSRAI